MTPAEAGTLVDEDAAMRDITATIVDLAVRGYLVIEEKDKVRNDGAAPQQRIRLSPEKEARGMGRPEAARIGVARGNFLQRRATDVELSALQNQFYKNLPGIKNGIFDALMERGYFQHRPDYVRSGFVGGGIVVGVAAVFVGQCALAKNGNGAGAVFRLRRFFRAGSSPDSAGSCRRARPTGRRPCAGVLGFEDFLTHVEADRMDRISQTPETFEKFLPFAMALGVEKKWVGAFQNIYTQPPSWYQGGYYNGGFYPIMFVNSLDNMTTRASSVMASAPRSSGGSGFGGGGSSGGGMGGGGGGGF